MMPVDWTTTARNDLALAWQSDQGWGYQADGAPYVEPTALAALALSVRGEPEHSESIEEHRINSAGTWLASLQRSDGSLGISAALAEPGWATPWAMLLWAQLGQRAPLQRAANWLAARRGHTFVKRDDSLLGHDTMLPGWPWVEGTHSWVEPTATAVLALCRSGHLARIDDGVAVLLDRAVPTGGWNVGNNVVRGRVLRPQCSPTGLALLALAAAGVEATPVIDAACVYLRRALPQTRAPQSLSWGLMGLRAWRRLPEESPVWLAESFQKVRQRGGCPLYLAQLLLASAAAGIGRLGVFEARVQEASK